LNENKENIPKTFNTNYFIIIVAILVILGFIILYFSGSFSSVNISKQMNGNQLQQNNVTQQTSDLSALNEIQNLEKLLKQNPNDFDTLLKLSHLLNDSGFYNKAIKSYKKYLERFPNNVDVIIDMGVCYYQLQNYDTAISTMLSGLEINPNHQIANFNLGIIYSAKGQHNKAIEYWRKAYKINPNSDIGIKAKNLLDNH